MRISDWSSDVCSSDLLVLKVVQRPKAVAEVPLQELEMSDVEDLAGQHGEEEVPAAADLSRRIDVPARIDGVGPGFELSHILHQAGGLLGRDEGGHEVGKAGAEDAIVDRHQLQHRTGR